MIEMQVEVVGFEELKDLYEEDADFGEAWRVCKSPISANRTKWLDYIIQDDMLFIGNQLCIPRSSMRLNLIKEKHSGGLAGNFGMDKTLELVSEKYYWHQI